MNASINNDIRNSANKITDNIRKESANISKSAIDMGKDIQNNVKDATLKARQIGRRTMSNAEGLVNDTRIRVGNKANEIQQQAVEMKDQAVGKANELKDQAVLSAKNLKEQAEVAVGIQQEKGLFTRLNPMQYLKLPTLSNITSKLSPKNLICGNNTSNNQNKLGLPQMGGNGKESIIELLKYNLEKREKILDILFEDAMKIVAVKGTVSKNKENRILKLIHEIDIIKTKLKNIKSGLPKVKKRSMYKKNKTGKKSRKKKSKKRRKYKKKTKKRK
jgi:hypothetical protein